MATRSRLQAPHGHDKKKSSICASTQPSRNEYRHYGLSLTRAAVTAVSGDLKYRQAYFADWLWSVIDPLIRVESDTRYARSEGPNQLQPIITDYGYAVYIIPTRSRFLQAS